MQHQASYFITQLLEQISATAILTDTSFVVISANKIACNKLGIAHNEIAGRHLRDLIESDYSEIEEIVKLDNDDYFTAEVKLQLIHCQMRNYQIIPFLDNNNKRIGLLIKAKSSIQTSNENQDLLYDINLYKILANSLPGINLYLFDNQTKFLIAEGHEMKNIGLSSKDFLNRRLEELRDRNLIKMWSPLFNKVFEGKEGNIEYNYENYFYKIWALPLKKKNGDVYAGIAITQNITDEKRYKKRLKRSKEDAEQANRTKSEFLAQISHEIRTPLNAIIGFSEQLASTKLNKKQEDYIKIIDKSSEHLLSLINDILVLSKIEAKEIRFDEIPFRLANVAKYVHKTFLPKAHSKRLSFNIQVDEKLDRVLIGDPFRLRQILINLVSNAVKFTKNGTIDLKIFLLSEDEGRAKIRFDIADTGIGIAEENLEKIFDQFKQSDSRITREFGGTGLGLTICKKLVDLQNGTITVYSKPNLGTTFSFTLSYQKGKEKDIVNTPSVSIDEHLLKNKKALLVDDDSVNRLLGKTILEKLNCNIDIAHDGKEAIEKIEKNNYDFILLDIHMPEVSGIDVVKHLRYTLNDNETRVIAVTAAALQKEIQSYYAAGFNNYLTKPYKEINLFNVICQTLDVKRKQKKQRKGTKKAKASSVTLYKLDDLKAMSNGEAFLKKMLNTFIENAEDGIERFEKASKLEDWSEAGEIAHKMLPSFKHLHVDNVIDVLDQIKTKALIQNDYRDLAELVKQATKKMKRLIKELKKEPC